MSEKDYCISCKDCYSCYWCINCKNSISLTYAKDINNYKNYKIYLDYLTKLPDHEINYILKQTCLSFNRNNNIFLAPHIVNIDIFIDPYLPKYKIKIFRKLYNGKIDQHTIEYDDSTLLVIIEFISILIYEYNFPLDLFPKEVVNHIRSISSVKSAKN